MSIELSVSLQKPLKQVQRKKNQTEKCKDSPLPQNQTCLLKTSKQNQTNSPKIPKSYFQLICNKPNSQFPHFFRENST